jgi:hypothetical protein
MLGLGEEDPKLGVGDTERLPADGVPLLVVGVE